MLCPDDYPIGTKRLCVDTDYYETFNRDNVTLVDLRATPIETITRAGIRTATARIDVRRARLRHRFDAMTGALVRATSAAAAAGAQRPVARRADDVSWPDVAGFPNLFMVTGPGSPSVLCNMIVAIEQHVNWIGDCMHLHARPRARNDRAHRRPRSRLGRARQRLRRRSRCIRCTPGTWAPTSPASPGCSCPTAEGSTLPAGVRRSRDSQLPRLRSAPARRARSASRGWSGGSSPT